MINRSFKNAKIIFILFLLSFCINVFAGDIEKGLKLFKKQEYEKALPYFQKPVAQKNPDVQAALGYMYREGLAVPKDIQKAFDLFLESARQNNPRGQYGMGTMYDLGLIVKQDKEKAFKWYKWIQECPI